MVQKIKKNNNGNHGALARVHNSVEDYNALFLASTRIAGIHWTAAVEQSAG